MSIATRRRLLGLALAAPAAALAGAAAAAEGACVDLDALTSGQRSMRETLNFKLQSDDARHCGACAFFTAADGGCGNCQILGGPVPATGRCDSWAQKK
jgi:hypothetical protein